MLKSFVMFMVNTHGRSPAKVIFEQSCRAYPYKFNHLFKNFKF